MGRYPPACCSSRLPVFLLRLLQKVNGAQCQQLSLAVLLAWLEPRVTTRIGMHSLVVLYSPEARQSLGVNYSARERRSVGSPLSCEGQGNRRVLGDNALQHATPKGEDRPVCPVT